MCDCLRMQLEWSQLRVYYINSLMSFLYIANNVSDVVLYLDRCRMYILYNVYYVIILRCGSRLLMERIQLQYCNNNHHTHNSAKYNDRIMHTLRNKSSL